MYAKLKEFIATYWLIVFFFLIAVIVMFSGISVGDIFATLLELQFWQLLLLVFVFLIATGIHITSRKYLLSALGADCGLKNLSYIHFSTLAAHYSTPVKIGIPVAIYLLNKIEKVEYSKSTAMLFLEIGISTSLCGLIALVGIPAILGITLQYALVITALGIFCMLLIFYVLSYIHKSGKHYKILDYLFNTLDAVRTVSPIKLIGYLLLSIVLRLADALGLFILCVFFLEDITIWQSVITTSTAFFIGTISMIPMGMGTRDISILLLLQHYNLSNESAIVIVTLQRVLTTGLSFILGIYCGSVLGMKNAQATKQGLENLENQSNSGDLK